MDTKKQNEGNLSTTKVITRCKYDEICSKYKLCGDCSADLYESEQYEEELENFNLDRKMALRSHR